MIGGSWFLGWKFMLGNHTGAGDYMGKCKLILNNQVSSLYICQIYQYMFLFSAINFQWILGAWFPLSFTLICFPRFDSRERAVRGYVEKSGKENYRFFYSHSLAHALCLLTHVFIYVVIHVTRGCCFLVRGASTVFRDFYSSKIVLLLLNEFDVGRSILQLGRSLIAIG